MLLAKKVFISLVCCILVSFSGYSQKYTISGYVTDTVSGEKLIGATIYETNLKQATATNSYGFYSLSVQPGEVRIAVSFVGYKTEIKTIDLSKNVSIDFALSPNLVLDEVLIEGTRTVKQIESSQMSTVHIPMKQIAGIPSLMGEVDLLKLVQLYPGVSSGAEGSAGLYVRGGSPDQNLILLDGVPVYNISHLFGFVSVFNPDAISNVQLYKGGFPARFGGRLSSVLDVSMKEGNNRKFQTQGSVGLLSSKIAVEGPIIKDKASFIVTARRSFIDLLLKGIGSTVASDGTGETQMPGYYFFDLNTKFNYRFSNKSRIYFGLYSGEDKLSLKIKSKEDNIESENNNGMKWGNLTSSLRWNYKFSGKLFGNATVAYSKFQFNVFSTESKIKSDTEEATNFNFISNIEDFSIKYDVDYVPNPEVYIKSGLSIINHTFRPGIEIYEKNENTNIDKTLGNNNIFGTEFSAYIEDDFTLGSRFKANAGLHYSGFTANSKFYHSLQPRVSGRYLLNDNFSLKAAYSTMSQYIHLVSKSNIGLPVDLWVPVTDKLKPLLSNQVSVGIAAVLFDKLDLSIEGYYKTMKNVLEFAEGSTFFNPSSKTWEDELESGKGKAYGIEFLLEKKKGKLSGWIAYTLAYNYRQFDKINFGNPYFYTYDQRHNFNIVLNYKVSEKSDFGAVWIFSSGRAYTIPTEVYFPIDGYWGENPNYMEIYVGGLVENSSKKNNYRVPAYHRLDVSYNRHKKTKWGERTWSFGLFNAYNRLNPFHIKLETEGTKSKLVQYTLFPILPFVNYSFRF